MSLAAEAEEAGRPHRPDAGLRICGAQPLSIAMAALDLFLIWGWASGDTTTMSALVWHGAATCVLSAAAWPLQRRHRIAIVSALLTCLLLGPIGGLVLVIIDLSDGPTVTKLSPHPIDQQTKALADVLHSQITQQRRRATATGTANFVSVFRTGSLHRQQEAIAAISQRYTPAMMPALQQALASDIPAIRVQAAAVFAKLRGVFTERCKAVLLQAARESVSPALAAEARAVAASGFVDHETAAALGAVATRPTAQDAPPLQARVVATDGALVRPPSLKRHACGGIA